MNRLGSIVAITDEAGQVVWEGEYFAYGSMQSETGGDNSWKFTGQEKDVASGMYNFKARFYDMDYEHFLTRDPAGEGFSPYMYVQGKPTSLTDYTGSWVGTDGHKEEQLDPTANWGRAGIPSGVMVIYNHDGPGPEEVFYDMAGAYEYLMAEYPENAEAWNSLKALAEQKGITFEQALHAAGLMVTTGADFVEINFYKNTTTCNSYRITKYDFSKYNLSANVAAMAITAAISIALPGLTSVTGATIFQGGYLIASKGKQIFLQDFLGYTAAGTEITRLTFNPGEMNSPRSIDYFVLNNQNKLYYETSFLINTVNPPLNPYFSYLNPVAPEIR